MEGSKIKNIVIVILLLLNGFLLVLSVGRRMADAGSENQARTSAIEVIRANGIELDENAVPKRMDRQPMQVVRDMELEAALAGKLLGGSPTREHRGGEVYRYHNGAGSIEFHSTGEVSARFEKGTYPLEQTEPGQHAASVAKLLGCRVLVTAQDISTDGTGTVTLRQTLNGIGVVDCVLTARYQQGDLVELKGVRLPGKVERVRGEEPVTVATAMVQLYNGLKRLGDIYSRIESIDTMYALNVRSIGVIRLDPVWAVRTDTGAYLLNTMTGGLSRANRVELVTE